MEKIIKNISNKFYKQLLEQKHITPGHNGPHNDKETPVRNTSHWLISFANLYKKFGDEFYLDAVNKCAKYLCSNQARPMNATFYCRMNPHKDLSNGLIGQAWVIESLVEAYKLTNNNEYIEIATEVFLLHPFDDKLGLWKIVNVDGSYKRFDLTFNHQLWFAASGALLVTQNKNNKISEMLNCFFNKIDNNLETYNNGLIKHSIRLKNNNKNKTKNIIKKIKKIKYSLFNNLDTKYKENGYHIFNVYAFALIKNLGFECGFFQTKKFNNIINYAFSNKLLLKLKKNNYRRDYSSLRKIKNDLNVNRYGYAYNAPGFELPFIYEVFKSEFDINVEIVNKAIKTQIEFTYNNRESIFSNNTEDSITLTARLYEYVRFLEKYNFQTKIEEKK